MEYSFLSHKGAKKESVLALKDSAMCNGHVRCKLGVAIQQIQSSKYRPAGIDMAVYSHFCCFQRGSLAVVKTGCWEVLYSSAAKCRPA